LVREKGAKYQPYPFYLKQNVIGLIDVDMGSRGDYFHIHASYRGRRIKIFHNTTKPCNDSFFLDYKYLKL
jgi:hypothetical protein